jgi:lipopolysaccharide export system permease protein
MQFLMNYLSELVGKGLDNWVIIELITYNIAWMVVLAVPMGVLFATMMTFGGMSQAHEVTIIKASGGSLLFMMFPVILLGLILSYGLYLFNDQVLPKANHRAKILMSDIQRKKPTFILESGQFSTQLEGYTILARRIDSASGRMYGVTIYDMTNFYRRNVISSDSGNLSFTADYKTLIIDLFKGEVHQFGTSQTDNYRIVNFDYYRIRIPAVGFAFEQSSAEYVSKGDRELSIAEMQEIVDSAKSNYNKLLSDADSLIKNNLKENIYGIKSNNKITKNSLDNINFKTTDGRNYDPFPDENDTSKTTIINRIISKTNIEQSIIEGLQNQASFFSNKIKQYKVEIYKKYAIPFACFIFVLVGCPLGIITKGGNFGISAGISLLFYIIYWVCLIGGEKLADRGMIEPWLAMWLGNIIIGILGILLTLRVNYESIFFFNSNLYNNIKKFFRK